MKKLLALLLCALLLMPAALAADSRAQDNSEGIEIVLFGERIFLDFDSSPEYTTVEDGMITASFYTYGPDEASLYELYLSFPETVQAGDVISPSYAIQNDAPDCSVSLIYSTEETEQYYIAGQLGEIVYPDGSDYAIRFDDVARGDTGIVFSGVLNAVLVLVDLNSGLSGDVVKLEDAHFTFTLSTGPAIPRATAKPVLPPDMYRC